jgi:hypothetical protein
LRGHRPAVYKNEPRQALNEGKRPEDAGDLNYVITQSAEDYIGRKGGVRHAYLNGVVGALEGIELELYRRVAATYEEAKIAENGDVYANLP